MKAASREATPVWKTWDSCCIFSAKETRLAASLLADFQRVTIKDAIDIGALIEFSSSHQIPVGIIVKLACCSAVGGYAGVEDVCIGVETGGTNSLLRCHLDSQQAFSCHSQLIEEIELPIIDDSSPNLLDLAGSTGLFDTILSIRDPDSGATAETSKGISYVDPPRYSPVSLL